MSARWAALTGFYLLTTGLTPAKALDLTRSAFAWMAEYEGEIPGASGRGVRQLPDDGPHCPPKPRPPPCCPCWKNWMRKSCTIDN